MNNIIQKTRTFNEMFQELPTEPTFNKDAIMLRYALIKEELDELRIAANSNDFEEVRDAIADINYVLCGLINILGLDAVALSDFMAVHSSNMAKFLDTEEEAIEQVERYKKLGTEVTYKEQNGKYSLIRFDGKLIKPTNWKKHDFVKIDI